nr:hypothetical protein [Tanacetum cinerariifolium]
MVRLWWLLWPQPARSLPQRWHQKAEHSEAPLGVAPPHPNTTWCGCGGCTIIRPPPRWCGGGAMEKVMEVAGDGDNGDGGWWQRVRESGMVDLIDREMGSIFEFAGKTRRKKFFGGGGRRKPAAAAGN